MRSRLDEIVEEEMILAGWHPMPDSRATAMKIAERAFRHGVELALAFAYSHGANPRYETNMVQPEPAEEKCEGCADPTQRYRVGCPKKDRRKGQRRQRNGHCACQAGRDRRCCDRRKP